jgi:hypothetical protein
MEAEVPTAAERTATTTSLTTIRCSDDIAAFIQQLSVDTATTSSTDK